MRCAPMGVVVWAMIDEEADDALAAAAKRSAADKNVSASSSARRTRISRSA
jgi:hypothetical protein